MAAKHDGKKARANHWVMQQNLAKQKGGRPGYQFAEKKTPKAAAAVSAKKSAGPTRSKPTAADSIENAGADVTSAPEPSAPEPGAPEPSDE